MVGFSSTCEIPNHSYILRIMIKNFWESVPSYFNILSGLLASGKLRIKYVSNISLMIHRYDTQVGTRQSTYS